MFIINHKKFFIGLSVVLVALSIIFLSVFGLKIGIDFKGGALTEVSYTGAVPENAKITEALKPLDLGEIVIQSTNENGVLIKTRALSESERAGVMKALSFDGKEVVTEKSYNSIGPSVGKELKRKSIVSIILVSLGIIFFIAFAFRRVSRPVSSWKYGIIAIVTLLHDVFIPVGLFTLLSHYAGAEVDTLFVVAVLTVLGLSVSDTIVVFDRIRENQNKHVGNTFAETVGASITQTFTRSINTSLTVILALLALYFFGPVSTKYFSLMLTVGMFFGTYSSIFLASPLLVTVQEWQDKKVLTNKKGKK